MLDNKTLLAEARDLLPNAVAIRRKIHSRPELGLDLPETTATVLEGLQGLDVQIARGPSTSGLVVSLTGTKPGSQSGKTILLRGDMDALPMPEATGLPYASEIPNRMHACGHDVHTAMLVQAVHLLHRHRDQLAGTVKFMFQPGEEGFHGAKFMIEDGLLDSDPKPDAAFAMHISPTHRSGELICRPGPMMASGDTWTILVKGKGGHASQPFDAVDPMPVAFEIGLALQSMVTRRVETFDPVVLTCTRVTGGTTNNVIPETVELLGTLRSFSDKSRRTALDGMERVMKHVAAAHLCSAELSIKRGYPVTVNNPDFVDFARGVAIDLIGDANYSVLAAPIMGAEDFSYVLQRYPGCMMFLGVRPEALDKADHVPPCHSNHMTVNESAMAVGIAMHAAIAQRFLAEEKPG